MKRFTDEELQKANSVDLKAYLEETGIEVNRLMRSPFRDDQHPSFSVFCGRDGAWRGKDLSTGKVYDAIAIASKLMEMDFVSTVKGMLAHGEAQEEAIEKQGRVKPQGVEKGAEKGADKGLEKGLEKEGQSEAIQYEWLNDNTPALEYLTNIRGIKAGVINDHKDKIKCVNIITSKNGKTYRNRCVAFANENGGWMCRSINPAFRFEHKIAPDGLTIFNDNANNRDVYIFESAIDALSYDSLYARRAGAILIALNGCNNHRRLLMDINFSKNIEPVVLLLDRDAAGDETTKKIQEGLAGKGMHCEDFREHAFGTWDVKDVNELLAQKNIFDLRFNAAKARIKIKEIIKEPEVRQQQQEFARRPLWHPSNLDR